MKKYTTPAPETTLLDLIDQADRADAKAASGRLAPLCGACGDALDPSRAEEHFGVTYMPSMAWYLWTCPENNGTGKHAWGGHVPAPAAFAPAVGDIIRRKYGSINNGPTAHPGLVGMVLGIDLSYPGVPVARVKIAGIASPIEWHLSNCEQAD